MELVFEDILLNGYSQKASRLISSIRLYSVPH